MDCLTAHLRYRDHAGLWEKELKAWVPETIFDAHAHLGPKNIVSPLSEARKREALTTFTWLENKALWELYSSLYSGKKIAGILAFPFPLREVDLDRANDYLIEVMRGDARVAGCFLAHPTDARRCVVAYERAVAAGVRFRGAKPYYDLTRKGVRQCTMPEFVSEGLWQLLNDTGSVLMLHTSGVGMSDPESQKYLRNTMRRYPRVRVVLAHLGRYLEPSQCLPFLDARMFDELPGLYTDMASVSEPAVFARLLQHKPNRARLLFGADIPFGLISGVERWSPSCGSVFLTRGDYTWSDKKMQARFAAERRKLTYNTYHCIKALKDGIASLNLPAKEAEELKEMVFCKNALALVQKA